MLQITMNPDPGLSMVSEHSHPLDSAVPDSTSNSKSMDEMTALLMKWSTEDKKEYEIRRKEKSRMDELFTRVQIGLQQVKSSLRELRENMVLEDETDSDPLPENVKPVCENLNQSSKKSDLDPAEQIPEGFELVKGRILQIEATEPFDPVETSRKSGNPLRSSVEHLVCESPFKALDIERSLKAPITLPTSRERRTLAVERCYKGRKRKMGFDFQIEDGDDSILCLSMLFGNDKEVSDNVGCKETKLKRWLNRFEELDPSLEQYVWDPGQAEVAKKLLELLKNAHSKKSLFNGAEAETREQEHDPGGSLSGLAFEVFVADTGWERGIELAGLRNKGEFSGHSLGQLTAGIAAVNLVARLPQSNENEQLKRVESDSTSPCCAWEPGGSVRGYVVGIPRHQCGDNDMFCSETDKMETAEQFKLATGLKKIGTEHRDVILLLGVCVSADFCRGLEIELSVEMISPCPLTPEMITFTGTSPNDFEGGYEFLYLLSLACEVGIHALIRQGGSRVIASKISVPLNGLVKHEAPMDRLVSEFYNEVKLEVVLGVTRTLRSQKTFSSYEDVIMVSVFDFFSFSHEDKAVILPGSIIKKLDGEKVVRQQHTYKTLQWAVLISKGCRNAVCKKEKNNGGSVRAPAVAEKRFSHSVLWLRDGSALGLRDGSALGETHTEMKLCNKLLAKPGKEDGNKSFDKRAVRFYMKENLVDAQLTFKEEMMARGCLALSKEMEDSERGGNLAKTTMASFENHSISVSTYEAFQSPRPPELSLFIVRFRHWMSKKLEVGVVEKKTRATLSSSDKTWSEVYGAFSSIRSWRTWCRKRIEDQFLFSRADIFITEMGLLIKVAGAVLQGLRYLILAEVQVQCGGNEKEILRILNRAIVHFPEIASANLRTSWISNEGVLIRTNGPREMVIGLLKLSSQ